MSDYFGIIKNALYLVVLVVGRRTNDSLRKPYVHISEAVTYYHLFLYV